MIDPQNEAATYDYPTGVFSSIFTGNESFLVDHIINNKKIMPGVAYIEMVRAAVKASADYSDEYFIQLKDSVFIQPLIVDGKTSLEVKVYPGEKGEFGAEVVTEQGVHFQTKIYLKAYKKNNNLKIDIKSIETQCLTAGYTKKDSYQKFKEMGIQYGKSHQGIEKIKLGDNSALIKLALPGSSQRGMELDPGMLDSIVHSAAVSVSSEDSIRVPFSIKSTEIYNPLTDDMYAYLVETNEGINFTIADEKGEVKVRFTGFVGREIDLSPSKDSLVYYRLDWLEDNDDEPLNSVEKVTIIEGGETYSELVKTLFNTAKKLIQEKTEGHLLELRIPGDRPSWKGIDAALKAIHREYPKIEYRLKVGETYVKPDYTSLDKLPLHSEFTWEEEKTVLITGGLGGLGVTFAQDILKNSRGSTVILVGRSALDDAKQRVIQKINTFDSKLVYEACDITDKEKVFGLIKKYPKITGVIHGAGLIKDNYIINKTLDEIEEVLAPKVEGLQYLDKATANLALDYFVTLSSMAGALGNAGQIDYSAANGYMDAYMRNRADKVIKQERHGASVSINWPLWISEGMQVDEATKQAFLQVFKIKPLPIKEGLIAFKKIMKAEHPQVMVMFGDQQAIDTVFFKHKLPKEAKKTVQDLSTDTGKLHKEVLLTIKIQAAEHLKMPSSQIDEETDWADFGFDSILLTGFVNNINKLFNLDLMPTVLFEATNVQLLTDYLIQHYPKPVAEKLSVKIEQPDLKDSISPVQESKNDEPKKFEGDSLTNFAQRFEQSYQASTQYREEDIAIVGMSCRIAGAHNIDEFWQLLENEKDMIREIPKERWDWRDYPEGSKWGSFIDGVAEFDPLFFGLSPAEALYMAPEQRLMMQSVWECLENSGCAGESIKGTNTGIFVGCTTSGYSSLLKDMPVQAYSSTGAAPSIGPNRISYLMDWNGPSEPIETACSSSLVAVHRAVETLRLGHCKQAIAGGVNLLLSPESYISFTKAGMLSKDGRCKTFSNKANGYVRGEGIGMVMLKPLSAAIKDGNVIHAVIKGTAENHGGRTNSLTAPNPKSQAAVIKKAVADGGVDFNRISYVECHGTGTELGDPIEIEGLKTVAAQSTAEGNQQNCKLGSIKSNIGHLELAAGIVGLIKVVLQMQHKKIVKSLHCDEVNPYIDLVSSPYTIAQKTSDWKVGGKQTRLAGVSSFGFGGVNAHVILEEYRDAYAEQTDVAKDTLDSSPQLIVLSAKDEERLLDSVGQYLNFIDQLPKDKTTLNRLAYTLQTGRTEMQERVAFIVRSIDEWKNQLNSFKKNKGKTESQGIYRGTVKTGSEDKLEIGDTQAGKNYLRQLIVDDEAGKLAELWVRGTKIDWQALHA